MHRVVKHRLLHMDFPLTPLPENIKSFQLISIQFGVWLCILKSIKLRNQPFQCANHCVAAPNWTNIDGCESWTLRHFIRQHGEATPHSYQSVAITEGNQFIKILCAYAAHSGTMFWQRGIGQDQGAHNHPFWLRNNGWSNSANISQFRHGLADLIGARRELAKTWCSTHPQWQWVFHTNSYGSSWGYSFNLIIFVQFWFFSDSMRQRIHAHLLWLFGFILNENLTSSISIMTLEKSCMACRSDITTLKSLDTGLIMAKNWKNGSRASRQNVALAAENKLTFTIQPLGKFCF